MSIHFTALTLSDTKLFSDDGFDTLMEAFSDPFLKDFDGAFTAWIDPTSVPIKDNYSTRAWLMLQANPQ